MDNANVRRPVEFLRGRPGLPFSAGARVGDVLFLSGQIGTDASGSLVEDFDAQVRQALDNVAATLESAGLSISDVFKVTVMLDDMSLWSRFNAIYLEYFDADRLPARSAFGTNGLALGAALEIECWASAPKG